MAVLSLNINNTFWRPPGPEVNSMLNTLQFAAKVHESLIILLSSVVFNRIRIDLIGGRGVPLGLLCSADQFNPLTYFFRWELWGGLLGRQRRGQSALPTGLLVLVASAITMIPKLDWWPFAHFSSEGVPRVEVYMQAPVRPLSPVTVTVEDVPSVYFEEAASPDPACPASGFSRLLTGAVLPIMDRTSDVRDFYATNLTMSIKGSGAPRYMVERPVDRDILAAQTAAPYPSDRELFAATTVSDFVAYDSVWYWDSLSKALRFAPGLAPW